MILSVLPLPLTASSLHSPWLHSLLQLLTTRCTPPSTHAPLTLVPSWKLTIRVFRDTSLPQVHHPLPPLLRHTLSFHPRSSSPHHHLRTPFPSQKTHLLPKLLVIPPPPPPILISPSQNYPPNSMMLYPPPLPTVGPVLLWSKMQICHSHLGEQIMGMTARKRFRVFLRPQTQMRPLTSARLILTLLSYSAHIARPARTKRNQLLIYPCQMYSVVRHMELHVPQSLKHLVLDFIPRLSLNDLLHLCR